MFGFLFRKKKDEVRGLLSGLMNRSFMNDMRFGKRQESRGYMFEVVWAVPYGEDNFEPSHDLAFPVVTKDISADGLSIIHHTPITLGRILIGIQQDMGRRFLLCNVGHSTPLGYGFYQIGLSSREVVNVDELTLRKLEQRMSQFDQQQEEMPELVGV